MFKVDAHKRIDRVSKLGRDAILSESLDAASRGSGEYAVIHRTIQDRFRTLIPDLATGGIDEIVALDNKGRVIARVGGDNEKEYGDFIGGVEVVADALRGYLSDDAWGVGGKLERVAGAPVLSKSKDRIVGAVYVGRRDGTEPGRAPQEEPRRRRGVAPARQGGGQLARRSATWTGSPSWSPSTPARSPSSSARPRCR